MDSESFTAGHNGSEETTALLRSTAQNAQSELRVSSAASSALIVALEAQLSDVKAEKAALAAQLEELKAGSKPSEDDSKSEGREEKGDDTPEAIDSSQVEEDNVLLSTKVPGTNWQSIVAVDARRLTDTALKGYPAQKSRSSKGLLLSRHRGGASKCKELSLVVVSERKQEQCVVVVEQHFDQFDVHQLETSGDTQPGGAPFANIEWTSLATAGYMPKDRQQKESLKKLTVFLEHREDMLKQLGPIVKKAGGSHRNTVTVMCINAGMLDLALNFVCSCRNQDIDIRGLVVFASDERTHKTLQMFGVQSFWHGGFGKLPSDSANGYGDATFVAMMWLKVCHLSFAVDLHTHTQLTIYLDASPPPHLGPLRAGGIGVPGFDVRVGRPLSGCRCCLVQGPL